MKTLISLLALVTMTSNVLAASTMSMEVNSKFTTITIALEREVIFTEKLVDALIKSPLVEEQVNDWVAPGTQFRGDGFSVSLDGTGTSSRAVLRVALQNSEIEGVSIQNNFIRVTSRAGAFKNIHEALLASRSQHVITHESPTRRISRQVGEVAVLESNVFAQGTGELSCIRGFGDFERSICSIKL